jgi:DNA-binding transcriptional LysR family regulator
MRGLSLDQLQAFADVIELGSFSAAAARLNLTQPAVSQQVRQLEARLGVRLIERVGRRATPTAAGRDLLQHARAIDAAVAAAREAMAAHAGGTVGRVRLATGATACLYLLPAMLRALRSRFPSLEIVVSTGNTPDILKSLEDNAIDVAFVTLPAPGRMFQVTPVLDDELVAIFPADRREVPRSVTPAALAQLPLVLYEPRGNSRRLVDDWFLRAGLSLKPVMELGSTEAIKELVGAGLGCGVLPRLAVPKATAGRQNRIILRSLTPRLHRELAVVLRRDKPLHRGLREVVKALTALGRKPR